MATVEAFWTPNHRILKIFSVVSLVLQVRVVLLSLLCIAIVNCNLIETYCAFWQQFHTIQTVAHLISGIFGENVVAFHVNMGLL